MPSIEFGEEPIHRPVRGPAPKLWRKATRGARGCAAVLLSLALAGCVDRADPPRAPQVEEWVVGAAPELVIGEAEGAPEYLFSRIAAVRLMAHGRIVVADGGSGTLRVFGADGRIERSFGGIGEGPGEFRGLGALHAVGGDTLLAYDPESSRLSTFLVSGELLSTTRIQVDDGYPEVYLGRDSAGRHYIAWIKQAPRSAAVVTPDMMEVARFDADGTVSGSLGVFPGMRRLGSPLPFSAHFVGAVVERYARNPNVSAWHIVGAVVEGVPFVGDGLRPALSALGTAATSVVPVSIGRDAWIPAEAWRRLEERVTQPALKRRLQEVRSVPGADSIPVFSEVVPDPRGRIWLKHFDPATDSHFLPRELTGGSWTVVDTEGMAVARVALPEGFRLLEVQHDRISGVHKDDLGVERIAVYTLHRREAEGR